MEDVHVMPFDPECVEGGGEEGSRLVHSLLLPPRLPSSTSVNSQSSLLPPSVSVFLISAAVFCSCCVVCLFFCLVLDVTCCEHGPEACERSLYKPCVEYQYV